MQTEKLKYRKYLPDDDMSLVARYIHLTDPYIYPTVCDVDDPFFTKVIRKCSDDRTNIYYRDNLFLALYEEKIIGVLVAVKCGRELVFADNLELSCDEHKKLIQANEGYFIPLIKESRELDGYNIINLCIDADYRKMGVGEGLLRFYLSQSNGESVYLDVLADNPGAIRLYERCGFEILQEYYGFSGSSSPVRCYHMKRNGT